MTLRTLLTAGLLAASIGSAHAIPTFTAPGGATYDPFGGIDWASNGTAYTNNFNFGAAVAGSAFNFDMTYIAYAKSVAGVLRPNGTSFFIPNLTDGADATNGQANEFELTIVATFNETATCTNSGQNCSFTLNSGSFDIRIGTGATRDAVTGSLATLTQYSNGVSLIAGTFTPASSGTFSATSGTGNTSLFGTVTSTNAAYINPALVGTTAVGTLQIGNAITSWQRPTGIVGLADTCGPTSGNSPCLLAFQADSNQDFHIRQVPEPATVALLGLGLFGAGVLRSKRKSQS